jgi:hypothetical protein
MKGMNMTKGALLFSALAVMVLLMFVSSAAWGQTTAFTVSGAPQAFTTVNGGPYQCVGAEFTVGSSPITITELGAYDPGGTHGIPTVGTPVGIFQVGNAGVLASATITSGEGGDTPGVSSYAFTAIAPITLLPNTNYFMAATVLGPAAGTIEYSYYGFPTATGAAGITFSNSTARSSSAPSTDVLLLPNLANGGTTGQYMDGNFQFNIAPPLTNWVGALGAFTSWDPAGNWSQVPAWNGTDNLYISNGATNDASHLADLDINVSHAVNNLTFNNNNLGYGAIEIDNITGATGGTTITLNGNLTQLNGGGVNFGDQGHPLTVAISSTNLTPTFTVSSMVRFYGANSLTVANPATVITLNGGGTVAFSGAQTLPINFLLNAGAANGEYGTLQLGGGVNSTGTIEVKGVNSELRFGIGYDASAGVATQSGNINLDNGATLALLGSPNLRAPSAAQGLITGNIIGGSNTTLVRSSPGYGDASVVTLNPTSPNTAFSGAMNLQAANTQFGGTWSNLGNISLNFSAAYSQPLSVQGNASLGMASGMNFTALGAYASGSAANVYATVAPTQGTMTIGTEGNGNTVKFQNLSQLTLNLNDVKADGVTPVADSVAIKGNMDLGTGSTTNVLRRRDKIT